MPETTQPTITNKNLPPSQQAAPSTVPAKESTPTPFDQIIAKPLRAPNFIGLKPKNPNLALYWGNRAVGEKESGMRYDQLIAMGFEPAKPEDVMLPNGLACPPSLQRDGRIMYGDLICLKIGRNDYVGALKWNQESATQRVRKLGQGTKTGSEHQQTDGRDNPSSVIAPLMNSKAGREGKVAAYIPKLAEVDSKTADNTGGFNLADK